MDITNAVGNSITSNLGDLDIIQFLGKGKSGYSYLAQSSKHKYVIKLMHYEQCSYYSFGDANKVELEVSAYKNLVNSEINIPKLLDINYEANYIIKEYIAGNLVTELIIAGKLPDSCIKQVCEMAKAVKGLGLNIDYFPDNFVLSDGTLYYIDYEHNPYDEKWDLVHWGLYYWANAKGMKAYKETNDSTKINECANSGIPIKKPFVKKVNDWMKIYK